VVGIREVKTAGAAQVGYFAAVQVNQRQQIDILARGFRACRLDWGIAVL
jgi:hypothetical protein